MNDDNVSIVGLIMRLQQDRISGTFKATIEISELSIAVESIGRSLPQTIADASVACAAAMLAKGYPFDANRITRALEHEISRNMITATSPSKSLN